MTVVELGTTPSGTAPNDTHAARRRETDRPPWEVFVSLLGVAALLVILYGLVEVPATLVVVELILAAASLITGGFLGFLFGIPRAVPPRAPSSTQATTDSSSPPSGYEPSTNLEQVADWLTKILVGVGLVELQQLGDRLGRLGDAIGSAFQVPGVSIVSQLILVSFLATGFVASFLWTRIYYGAIQTGADITVRDLLVRIRATEVSARTAEKLSTDLATGALKPVANERAVAVAARRRDDDPLRALPAEIAQRVEQLENWDGLDWDSDPGATLFPGAPVELNGRRLSAEIETTLRNALVIKLRVTRTENGSPLDRPVLFLLHPTYADRVEVALPSNDAAEIKIISEGEFTVVAIADDGGTVLSYPLAKLPGAPKWFLGA